MGEAGTQEVRSVAMSALVVVSCVAGAMGDSEGETCHRYACRLREKGEKQGKRERLGEMERLLVIQQRRGCHVRVCVTILTTCSTTILGMVRTFLCFFVRKCAYQAHDRQLIISLRGCHHPFSGSSVCCFCQCRV